MAHTPGPWKIVDHSKDEDCLYIESARDGICSVFTDTLTGIETERANARLIATAPELLESLKDALQFLDRPDITTYEWYKLAPEHVAKFRTAIAKAEGR